MIRISIALTVAVCATASARENPTSGDPLLLSWKAQSHIGQRVDLDGQLCKIERRANGETAYLFGRRECKTTDFIVIRPAALEASRLRNDPKSTGGRFHVGGTLVLKDGIPTIVAGKRNGHAPLRHLRRR